MRRAILVPLAVLLSLWLMTGYFNPLGAPPPLAESATCDKVVALTFDDGPGAYTKSVLASLRATGTKATFFVLGRQAHRFPELLREMANEGHEVENHSWSHPHLIFHSPSFVRDELEETNSQIIAITGHRPVFFRPPYGQTHFGIMKIAASLGLSNISWSITAGDWLEPGTDRICAIVVRHLKPGAIILLHDGGGNREQTASALGCILQKARGRGYRFVLLRDLAGLGVN